jgi:hypothetical protein
VVTGSQDGTNPAQIRGDIQAGRTRDKRPGFDPAAAPLETDAEAGGVAFNAEDVRIARRQNQSNPGHENSSHATAMRRAGDADQHLAAGLGIVGPHPRVAVGARPNGILRAS